MTEPAFGTDISIHNGNINWDRMVARNVKFVFIRAKYGTFTDTRFGANWPAAKAAGLLRGAYLFFRPANDQSPAAQAESFVSLLGNDLGELPLVVDVEKDRRGNGSEVPPPPFAVLEPAVRTCVERVAQLAGRKPLIYTSAGYWNKFLGVLPWAQAYDLWVANFVTTWTPTSRPRLPRNWTTHRFWQYSADGNGQGAALGVESRDIDLNLFNGDLAALRTYAGDVSSGGGVPQERTMWVISSIGLNFRSQPIISAATLIARLPFATRLTTIGDATRDSQGNLWFRARLMDGRIGFVCSFIASLGQHTLAPNSPIAPAAAVRLAATKVGGALRSQPVRGRVIAKLKQGDVLTLDEATDESGLYIGKRGHWLAVTDAQGRSGYVSAQNLRVMANY